MLLTGEVTIIFDGSGVIGSAVAQAVACEGVHVCLGARSQEKLGQTASIIRTAGGTIETSITDVLDEHNTSKEITRLVEQTGGIDVVVSAAGFMYEQGKRVNVLSLSEFMGGITPLLSAQLDITKAVTPHMGDNHAGVILNVVAPVVPMAMPNYLGHVVDCVGTEVLVEALVSEAGSVNVRVVDVRSHAIVDAVATSSYAGEIFSAKAQSMGLTVDQWLGGAA